MEKLRCNLCGEIFTAKTPEDIGTEKYDADAREQNLTDDQRLGLHKSKSGPLMKELKEWFDVQFEEKKVEPNSSLGQAIKYILNHWNELTLFLHQSGAPLDNVCERALKKAILNRKNALITWLPFGKTHLK